MKMFRSLLIFLAGTLAYGSYAQSDSDNAQQITQRTEAQTDLSDLNSAILEAETLINQIFSNPDLTFFTYKAEQLKEVAESSKEFLTRPTDDPSLIDQATENLRNAIESVRRAMTKRVIEVREARGLKYAIEADTAAQIQLLCDIDMTEITGKLCETFTGAINGSNPEGTTYALIGRWHNQEFDTQATSYFFEQAQNAEFSNITFKNFRVEDEATDSLGMISRRAQDCKFHNIQMEDISIHSGKSYVGTITGSAINCVFEQIHISQSTVNANNKMAGGVAGHTAYSQFRNCFNDSDVAIYALSNSSRYDAYCGGFVGFSYRDSFMNCENHALVGAAHIKEKLGGIVGYGSGSSFNDCINAGTILLCEKSEFEQIYNGKVSDWNIKSGLYVGGICGGASISTIEKCWNYGRIYNDDTNTPTGSIVGSASSTTINNCLSTEYNGRYCAAIVGADYQCKITNCLSTVDVQFTNIIFTPKDLNSGNNYSLLQPNSTREIAYCEMGVTAEMLNSGIVTRWLNNGYENRSLGIEPWRQNVELQGDETEVDAYPLLDPSHRVVTVELLTRDNVITTSEQLHNFAVRVNSGDQFACACLGADIDMTGLNRIPIGLDETAKHFRGIFDGRGHTIHYLNICDSQATGLFGAVHAGAEICNVFVDNSNFICEGTAGAGAIVGEVKMGWSWGNVIIENCGSLANVMVNGQKYAGGILGNVDVPDDVHFIKVYVKNCFSQATVTADKGNSALLCGYTNNNGIVSNCWSSGELRNGDNKEIWPYSIENDKDNPVAECLVGYDKNLDIQNCCIVNPEANVDQYEKYKDQYPLQAGVTIVSDQKLALGEITYQLNGCTNDVTKSLIWQQELGKDSHPVFGNKGLYHTREIAKDKYGTVCLPYQIKSDEHITYYTFVSDEIEDGTLKLNFAYAETVPAAVPALFLATEDQTYYFPGAGDDLIIENANCTTYSQTPNSEWCFLSYLSAEVVIDDEETAESFYYLSDNTIRNAKKITVPPYRAFFHGPSIDDLREMLGNQGAQSAHVRIVIDGMEGNETALELVVEDRLPAKSTKSYTLYGTEAGQGYRGIMIRDGKKVIS